MTHHSSLFQICFFCSLTITARANDGDVPLTVPTYRTYRWVRSNVIAWTLSVAPVVVNVAPAISAQPVEPSADSWILPARAGVVPLTAPTCWTAKHRPSPVMRSTADPVTVLVT